MSSKNRAETQLLITILLSLFLSIALVVATFTTGFSNRKFYSGKTLQISLAKGKNFIEELEKRKVRGRKVVIFSNSLYAEIPQFIPSADGQTNVRNLACLLNYRTIKPANNNFIYLAILKGLVREVYLFLPDEEWRRRKFDFWSPFLKLKGNSIIGNYYEGTPFTVSSIRNFYNFNFKEKPVLIVNPSAFLNWKKFLNKIQPDLIFILEFEK